MRSCNPPRPYPFTQAPPLDLKTMPTWSQPLDSSIKEEEGKKGKQTAANTVPPIFKYFFLSSAISWFRFLLPLHTPLPSSSFSCHALVLTGLSFSSAPMQPCVDVYFYFFFVSGLFFLEYLISTTSPHQCWFWMSCPSSLKDITFASFRFGALCSCPRKKNKQQTFMEVPVLMFSFFMFFLSALLWINTCVIACNSLVPLSWLVRE